MTELERRKVISSLTYIHDILERNSDLFAREHPYIFDQSLPHEKVDLSQERHLLNVELHEAVQCFCEIHLTPVNDVLQLNYGITAADERHS